MGLQQKQMHFALFTWRTIFTNKSFCTVYNSQLLLAHWQSDLEKGANVANAVYRMFLNFGKLKKRKIKGTYSISTSLLIFWEVCLTLWKYCSQNPPKMGDFNWFSHFFIYAFPLACGNSSSKKLAFAKILGLFPGLLAICFPLSNVEHT